MAGPAGLRQRLAGPDDLKQPLQRASSCESSSPAATSDEQPQSLSAAVAQAEKFVLLESVPQVRHSPDWQMAVVQAGGPQPHGCADCLQP